MEASSKSRMIFVNLPVRDLPRSIGYFRELGFEFDPRFTDETAACMILNSGAYVMLLTEPKFEGFVKRGICNPATQLEGLYAISASSREAVDALVEAAVAAGGSYAADKQDHGFMYGWSFTDLDGHTWEVFHSQEMPQTGTRWLFVNLPIRKLERSVEFFRGLGFTFESRYTSDDTTCMILGPEQYVMLLEDQRFKEFTKREICDPAKACEGIYAISAESRADVDSLVEAAVAGGGKDPEIVLDFGFMYERNFIDVDGHQWAVVWMDMSAVPGC